MIWVPLWIHRGSVISQDGLQTEFCLHVYALEIRGNDGPLTVLKDQLYRVGTWFDEHSILTQVHSPEKVPGVVEAVYHHMVDRIRKRGSRLSHEIETPFCESHGIAAIGTNGVLTVEGHDPQHPGR